MTLTSHAYLEIEGESTTATFEMEIGLQYQSQITPSYLMHQRGQYLQEAVNQTPGAGSFDAERRTGFAVDGGAGDWEETIQFETGLDDVQWGDGSGGTGQANVAQTDASGQGVVPISRLQVFQYWIAKSRSDSWGDTRLHVGEWTDGSIAHISGVSAGVYDEPMPIAIVDSNLSMPDPSEGPTTMDGTLAYTHVSLWGGYSAPDWVNDAIGAAANAADYIPDE